MPQDFVDCIKNGGRVVTKKLKNGKYIKICYDKEGNSHNGEVKKSKDTAEKYKIEESKKLVEGLLELKNHFNTNYHT
jgi:hypothetical protein